MIHSNGREPAYDVDGESLPAGTTVAFTVGDAVGEDAGDTMVGDMVV